MAVDAGLHDPTVPRHPGGNLILAGAYLWLRGLVPFQGYAAALVLGAVFSAIRVYPRFWNMWIQSTYPNRLLTIEFINGIISTLVVTVGLEILV